MTDTRPHYSRFRARLTGGERLLGTFIKMPTTQPIEILGTIGYDFVILDQEHAPLGRAEIDLLALAARAAGIAPLVRVGDGSDASVLTALDCGAVGVMFPHVSSAERAKAAARACRYASGTRGFAGMTRASEWGAVRGPRYRQEQDAQVACVAMIEDVEAVERIDEIVEVDGIDAVFIGRGDLAAAFGSEEDVAERVARLSERIAQATRAAGMPLMMLATDKPDAAAARAMGATAMLVASDHNFLRSAAAEAYRDYSALLA